MSINQLTRGLARISTLALCGFLALLTGPLARAQASFGAIVGTVTDATGADIPGAKVTLTNAGTNAQLTTTSGAGGTFNFLNLSPGAYSVTVSLTGFKSFTQPSIDVTIGGTSRINASLSTGDVAETVTVEANSAVALQTDTSSLGGVVEGRQVTESPLNGRNVNNLLDFIPGVIPGGGTAGNTVANGGSGSFQVGTQTQAIAYGNYQIGGGFSGQSLFFIDGVLSNIPENNVNSLVPTQDSVQEFRVSTNNVTAEFGGFGGGVVQISTKQGTNQFHGTIYDYFRNTALDANDYFDKQHGLARQPLHQNQYGGNIGGPILKDKLFAFFSFEREPVTSGGLDTFTLPTTAQLAGNFSAFTSLNITAANPTGQILFNPATNAPYACNGVANTLCASQIDPTALKILQLEFPTVTGTLALNNNTVNNYVGAAPITGAQNEFNARVDYNLGKTDQLFARYTFWNPHNGNSDPLGTGVGAGPPATPQPKRSSATITSSTHHDRGLAVVVPRKLQLPGAALKRLQQSTINPAYGALQAMQVNNHQGLLPGLGLQTTAAAQSFRSYTG